MNDKLAYRIVLTVSIIVFAVVVVLNRKLITPPEQYPAIINQLPLINALINGTCSVLLILSLKSIKEKKIHLHKKLNFTTFILSSLFLVSYIIYHFFAKETHYNGQGIIKFIYYFILITHILLAAIVLPMILLSFYYGINNQLDKHRKIVRFSFPIWLYVTITGVLVYLLISPYYNY
jgi:putative membrane protein